MDAHTCNRQCSAGTLANVLSLWAASCEGGGAIALWEERRHGEKVHQREPDSIQDQLSRMSINRAAGDGGPELFAAAF